MKDEISVGYMGYGHSNYVIDRHDMMERRFLKLVH